jgi:methyl-accepting chemotaxis protein
MQAIRYALVGGAIGLGFPVLATFVEARLRYSGNLLAAQKESPLLWIIDTAPLVVSFLAMLVGRRQDALVDLERSSERGFSATADDLSAAAQALLTTVQAFSAMTAETAASVKETTQTMSGLSHTAMQAALTAETVIGLAQQSRKSSEEGLQAVEVTCSGMAKLAEEVRGLSSRIDALNARMRDILSITSLASEIADRSERLADRAEAEARKAGPSASGSADMARELRAHATDARSAARRVQAILGEIHKAMLATLTAVEMASRRAESGVVVAAGTGETIRKLAANIRESSEAAKQIATVAQQQDRGFDEVLKAMNEIYRAVEEGVAATQQVAQEAKALNELALVIKEQVHGAQRASA